MPSLRSRLLIFALKNRHLLKLRLKPEVIDWNTSTVQLREEYEKAALRAGKIPAGIEVTPVSADGLTAEWITPGALRVSGGAPVETLQVRCVPLSPVDDLETAKDWLASEAADA